MSLVISHLSHPSILFSAIETPEGIPGQTVSNYLSITSAALPNYRVNKAVIASEAKQSNYHKKSRPDCFVASLLAMTLLFYRYLGIVLPDSAEREYTPASKCIRARGSYGCSAASLRVFGFFNKG